MDREEKLRAAKERLKQFQKKRQKDPSGVGGDDSSSEPRSSPFTTTSFYNENQHHEVRREKSAGELPVFTMGNSNDVSYSDSAPLFFDDPAISSTSSLSNIDTSPLHVSSYSDAPQIDDVAVHRNMTYSDAPINRDMTLQQFSTVSDAQTSTHSTVTSQGVDQSQSLLKSQLEEATRSKDDLEKQLLAQAASKEDLEKQLLVQAASIKQYDVYCQSLASELTTCQATLEKDRRDSRSALETESGSLRAQLQSHADSIKILVAEKADFEASLRKINMELANKNAELSRLQASTSSEAEAARREEDRAQARAEVEAKLGAELKKLTKELKQSKQCNEDLHQEVAELGSKMKAKEKAFESLKADLSLKSSKLEMAELNLAQLRAVKDDDESRNEETQRLAEKEAELARINAENEEHVRRVSELTAYIHQASLDREQIIHQYTSYSQQLASQIESLTHQLNDRGQEIHHLATREKDLVAHVQQLEGQLQKLIQGESNSKLKENESKQQRGEVVRAEELHLMRQQMAQLDAKVLEIQHERDRLQQQAQDQNSKIAELNRSLATKTELLTELETKLEMALSTGNADVSQVDLMAACQSDKVAASRAMVQNKQLKEQLDELQLAIVQVTNSKADILSDYDALKNAQAQREKEENILRMELRGLHAALAERDRNLNHMREQMKYYIAFAENSIEGHLESGPRKPHGDQEKIRDLISKLQNAKEEIRCLNSHNSELRSQLEVLSSRTRDSSGTPDPRGDDSTDTTPPPLGQTPSMSESPRPPPSPSPSGSSAFSSTESTPNSVTPSASSLHQANQGDFDHNVDANVKNVVAPESDKKQKEASPFHRQPDSIPPLSKDVALLKLEQKFKQAMGRIEQLTSEKEYLEHVIVQLQEETDTVGEYITIYQYQRQQQRRRLEENERQLQIVSRDKEDLKTKLSQLQLLVTSFVQDAPSTTTKVTPHATTASRVTGPNKSSLNGPINQNGHYEIAQDALASETSADHVEDKVSSHISETHQLTPVVDLTEPLAPVLVHTPTAATRTYSKQPHPSPTKADKILALISEIGANQMLTNMEDFQPWFWEHSPGKLINI